MGAEILAELAQVACAFDLGAVAAASPVTGGLIQSTWRLQTNRGVFIAQHLHPAFDPTVSEDAAAITTYLRRHGIPCPTYLSTPQGSRHWGRWRVMSCLAGQVVNQTRDPGWIYQVAWWTGRLHRVLAGWDYRCRFQLPHFHDTPGIAQRLQGLVVPGDLRALQDWLLETVPHYYLPGDLSLQLIHGDLKLSNFLFDDQGRVSGILDWDTCLHHSSYIDLGDGLRSWCAEDFSLFAVVLAGYRAGGAPPPHPALALQAWQLLLLELAMRFLIDIVEDSYFAWDPQRYPSRVAHNRARLGRQIEQFHRLVQERDQLLRG
ncbi:MAG: phosphotransferase [Thermostichales cyanobacterium SZTDM-1c_bins_54]